MRILILGAGGTGGCFGGWLVEGGADVTFLVRPKRAAQLVEHGLVVRSPLGDIKRPVKTLLQIDHSFDLILLSAKAYDLDTALDAIAPAIGQGTAIVPLLNGIDHIETLTRRFGAAAVMGGTCYISAALDEAGEVHHLGAMQSLAFGELDRVRSKRAEAFLSCLAATRINATLSPDILQAMWEKYVLLATLAATTSLLRAPIGDIMAAPLGEGLMLDALAECQRIAAAESHPASVAALQRTRQLLTERGSAFMGSIARDMLAGGPTEADHIIGALLMRAARHRIAAPILRVAYCNLQVQDALRRQGGAGPA
jgi:2-dehydropantoate 2-reductase